MTTPPDTAPFETVPTAASRLGLSPKQTRALVGAGWLSVSGRIGRTVLLDPASVAAVCAMPYLPAPSSSAVLDGYAVHTGGLAAHNPVQRAHYQRLAAGWSRAVPSALSALTAAELDKAWTAWWTLGADRAAAAVGLNLVQSTAGVVGDVRTITGWTAHPVDPAIIWFQTSPASAAAAARYTGKRLVARPGPPWQPLYV